MMHAEQAVVNLEVRLRHVLAAVVADVTAAVALLAIVFVVARVARYFTRAVALGTGFERVDRLG